MAAPDPVPFKSCNSPFNCRRAFTNFAMLSLVNFFELDITHNGWVNVDDLLRATNGWGACP